MISLAAGFVDTATLPVSETQQAVAALIDHAAEARQALQYGTTLGYTPLREAILQRYLQEESLPSDAISVDQVLLTAGSNQLLHLLAETLFDPGDIVLCSAPTYFVFLGLLANLGVRAVGVECDERGMLPERLAERLDQLCEQGERDRVKAVYLVSYCDNPRGTTLPRERRRALMQVCRDDQSGQPLYVIDDQAYRPLQLASDSAPGLAHFDESGLRTITAGTFSKSFSPGVRVGWGILPPELVAPLGHLKGNWDFGAPNLNQHLMHRVLQLGLLDSHIERLRSTYRKKLTATLRALEASLGSIPGVQWIVPDGGLYVWLELPEQVETGAASALFARAVARGVLYVPGEYCFAAEGAPQRRNTIRLSFGVPGIEAIEEGVAALGQAIADVLSA